MSMVQIINQYGSSKFPATTIALVCTVCFATLQTDYCTGANFLNVELLQTK